MVISQKALKYFSPLYIGFYSILKYYIWRIVKIIKETFENLKTVVITKKWQSFTIPGTGTLGMEVAIVNSLKKGDRLFRKSYL